MKDDAKNLESPNAPPGGALRRPYHQPRLVRFGRLTEITSAVGAVGAPDGEPVLFTQAG